MVELRIQNDGDACLYTSGLLGWDLRWCISDDYSISSTGFLLLNLYGTLNYMIDLGEYSSYAVGSSQASGPTTLCVLDCGLLKLYNFENKELWRGSYTNTFPPGFPYCTEPPTASPVEPVPVWWSLMDTPFLQSQWTTTNPGTQSDYPSGHPECPHGPTGPCWAFGSDSNASVIVHGLDSYTYLELTWKFNAPLLSTGDQCKLYVKYDFGPGWESLGGLQDFSLGVYDGYAVLSTPVSTLEIQVRVKAQFVPFPCYMSHFILSGVDEHTSPPTQSPVISTQPPQAPAIWGDDFDSPNGWSFSNGNGYQYTNIGCVIPGNCLEFTMNNVADYDVNFMDLSGYTDMSIFAVFKAGTYQICQVSVALDYGQYQFVQGYQNFSMPPAVLGADIPIPDGGSSYQIRVESIGSSYCFIDHLEIRGFAPPVMTPSPTESPVGPDLETIWGDYLASPNGWGFENDGYSYVNTGDCPIKSGGGCLLLTGNNTASYNVNHFDLSNWSGMMIFTVIKAAPGQICAASVSLNGGQSFVTALSVFDPSEETVLGGDYSIPDGGMSYIVRLESVGDAYCYFDHFEIKGINPNPR